MAKNFIRYFIGWIAALGLFNLITFITPDDLCGRDDNTTLFFIAYACITAFFLVQLICTYYVLSTKPETNTFYNLPLFTVSVGALIVMLFVGSICMAFAFIPDWLGIILCALVLTLNVILITGTSAASKTVSKVEEKVFEQTFFIKSMTVEAMTLVSKASDDSAKKAAHKVYEAFRYSDPMSNPQLSEVENRISMKFGEFSGAIVVGNANAIASCSDELTVLINERNAKCRLLK